MKLHLNISLRRALLATMAMVSLHTTQAELNTEYNGGHAYLHGSGTLTASQWNDIWNNSESGTLTLSMGTFCGTADIALESNTYQNGKEFYIGGEGYESNEQTANDGKLTITTGTELNVDRLILGSAKDSTGTLMMTGGTVNAGELIIGGKGSSLVEVNTGATLHAGSGSILLGAEQGANPQSDINTPNLRLKAGGTVTAQNLIIGDAGKGVVQVDDGGILEVNNIYINGEASSWSHLNLHAGAQAGVLTESSGTRKIDNLFIGDENRHGHMVNYTAITVGNTIIGHDGYAEIKEDASLTTDYLLVQSMNDPHKGLDIKGETTVNGVFVTTSGSQVQVLEGGTLTTAGDTGSEVNGTINNSGTWKITGETTINGTIHNNATWNIAGETTTADGSITNNGDLNVDSNLTTGTLDGTGTASIEQNGNWTLQNASSQDSITNKGNMTLVSKATVSATSIDGSGAITLRIDSSTAGGTAIKLTNATNNTITVELDLSNPESLLGVEREFLSVADSHESLATSQFRLTGDTSAGITWDYGYSEITTNGYTLLFQATGNPTDGYSSICFDQYTATYGDITEVYKVRNLEDNTGFSGGSQLSSEDSTIYVYKDGKYGLLGKNVDMSSTAGISARELSIYENNNLIASTGIGLTFRGNVSLHGEADKQAAIGFRDSFFIESSPSAAECKVMPIETITLEAGARVELKDMEVNTTHALLVSGTETNKASLKLDNTTMNIGTDSRNNPLSSYNGVVQTKHHVTPDSHIKHTVINMTNGASLNFIGHSRAHFEHCTLKGTGTIKNADITGGKLIAGNSPGVLELNNTIASQTEISFYFITNPSTGQWNTSGSNSDTTNLLSNYKVTQSVTLNNVSFKALYQQESGTGYADTTKADMNADFQQGASITLFTGNLAGLSGTYTFDTTTLPDLDTGLFWDTTRLFSTGMIFVADNMPIEELGEPVRIANTLVSAGETLLSFGNLAEKQAALRARGTTRTWGSALSAFHRVETNANRTGYNYTSRGGAVGVDYAFTDRTLAGVTFGLSRGENEVSRGSRFYTGGEIEQDGRMLGLYGTHQFRSKGLLDKMQLHLFAAHGWFENESTRTHLRTGSNATGEWDSEAWMLSATLSRNIVTDNDWVFTPFAGLEYLRASMDSFTERDGAAHARYSADEDYRKLTLKLGLGVSKTIGRFTHYASVSYLNDLTRETPTVTASGRGSLTDRACMPGRDAVKFNLGTTVKLNDAWDAYADYAIELRDHATEYHVNVGVGYTF